MSHQHGLGNNGPEPTGLSEPDYGDDRMILSYGIEDYVEYKKKIARYKFFRDEKHGGRDAVYGIDQSLTHLVDIFKSASRNYGTERRVILLHGPVGSAKSTIVRLLKKGLEEYSRTPDGAMFTFAWVNVTGDVEKEVYQLGSDELPCPMREDPLHLIPADQRAGVVAELMRGAKSDYPVLVEGDLCPSCRQMYRELTRRYKGDWFKVMTEKALTDAEVIDFADHHSGTVAMHPGQINPYKLGFELWKDIEDRWNKGKFGKEYDDCDDWVTKRDWDRPVGLGREKIFQTRRVHNDITFIDAFFTEEFCYEHKFFTYAFNPERGVYEIVDRNWKSVKQKLLAGLTNFGQPFIYASDGNFDNRGELLLEHRHEPLEVYREVHRGSFGSAA